MDRNYGLLPVSMIARILRETVQCSITTASTTKRAAASNTGIAFVSVRYSSVLQ